MRRVTTRYATSADGTRIAYFDVGSGPPLLITPPNTMSHCQLEWEHEYFTEWYEALLASGRRLIKFDVRGSGLSDRHAPITVDATVDDIAAVLAHAGVRQVDLYATFLLVAPAVRFAVRRPAAVRRLVLWGPVARAEDLPPMLGPLKALAESDWQFFTETACRVGAGSPEDDALARVMAAFWRESSHPRAVNACVEAVEADDVTEELRRLQVPTLVVGDRHLPVPRPEVASRVTSVIPDARLVVLDINDLRPTGTARCAEVIDIFDEFLGPARAPEPVMAAHPLAGVRAVLFSDLVEHTAMMRRLGDAAGRGVLREHEDLVRDTLTAHGGVEVKTMGDGFMAWFGSPAAALRCAVDLQRRTAERNATAEIPFELRIGVNAGEPIAEDGDLFGETVILAARIAAEARAGEILVPDHVRHLVAGKGLVFSPRGEFKPRGFDEAIGLSHVVE